MQAFVPRGGHYLLEKAQEYTPPSPSLLPVSESSEFGESHGPRVPEDGALAFVEEPCCRPPFVCMPVFL